MKKIVSVKQAPKLADSLRNQNKTIVLAGGCFDILHIGHIYYLKEAKKQGDALFVLLESDSKIRKTKGKNRPINSQKDRAIILLKLSCVDYVIPLTEFKKDKEYDSLINSLKPDIIATTKKDPYIRHKQRQAKMTGAKIIEVIEIERISDQSTSKISKLILNENDV